MTFEAGAITTSPGSSRRRMTALEHPQEYVGCKFGGCASQRRQAVRRRLDQESYISSSTIVVSQLGFSVNGRASSVVEAGVTQIKVTSTSSGEVGKDHAISCVGPALNSLVGEMCGGIDDDAEQGKCR